MTRSRTLMVAGIVAAAVIGATALAPPASAQTNNTASAGLVPFVLWAATGAVIGAVAWPAVVGGAAAAAVPAGVMSVSAFLSSGAAVGAVVGGVGYLIVR